MTPSAEAPPHPASSSTTPYRHEAFLYRGRTEYVTRIAGFAREAIEAGEPVLVAAPAAGLDLLRTPIAALDAPVQLVDMGDLGSNPARIIGMWSDYLEAAGGAPCRGVGEPVHAGRDVQQLVEYMIHERLLNLAFVEQPFHLLCPYDAAALDRETLDDARSCHPFVAVGEGAAPGDGDGTGCDADGVFSGPLPPCPPEARPLTFGRDDLTGVRVAVRSAAERAGIAGGRMHDLVLSVDEIATNALTHGGTDGTLRWWTEADRFVCEVSGSGTFTDPLVGRRRPRPDQPGGRGLWLAIQLCDLVQVRNVDGGTVVRLHLATAR